ncbi:MULTISPECIES: Ada metal-binding domain-containing protein [Ramlibacter]|uniref:DNA-3-methyladenine glycosylase II n=1 Tax=Ramlibacter aquaticus TaxID=2780094 RepID=A0ABR9SHA4_9BURK|nr:MULTISPECIES: Ada metal-binding domain-containing protein [Ramlibacter]MBE7941743.1 helix-turn-helix domain-containing protein [Ramlibacter aquaticus]
MDTPLAPDACYLALKAKDARFDGLFFTGVTSTGIYCRPVCRVRTPRRENCRFFAHAAQAELAGFRPCLRCRPEIAPRAPRWSLQDAGAMLAQQALALLDEPEAWPDGPPGPARLAARLGVSDRHLRRLFEAEFGVSPVQALQTRRLLAAKQLLADTALPVAQVARLAGFASLRRFNAAFAAHYRLSPTRLRREGAAGAASGLTVRLGLRPPCDVQALLGFFATRALPGVEHVQPEAGRMARTLALESGGRRHTGWVAVEFEPGATGLRLLVSDSLREVLPRVIRRTRAALDLDADPAAIAAVLHARFPQGDGLRVPGSFCGFELAVRAILGQQVTVAAARTFARRLVERFGEAVDTPDPLLTRCFPSAQALAGASGDALGALGIVRQRQAAILALAREVAEGRLALHLGAELQPTLQALRALPGVGDWTAQYTAMRALRWPDAFPAGDVALHKALGVAGEKNPARAAEAASQAWRPWRSYAVIRAWAGLG